MAISEKEKAEFLKKYAAVHEQHMRQSESGMTKEQERSFLENLCEQKGFAKILAGNVYCSLALEKKPVHCIHLSVTKDHNGISCLNPLYQIIKRYEPSNSDVVN